MCRHRASSALLAGAHGLLLVLHCKATPPHSSTAKQGHTLTSPRSRPGAAVPFRPRSSSSSLQRRSSSWRRHAPRPSCCSSTFQRPRGSSRPGGPRPSCCSSSWPGRRQGRTTCSSSWQRHWPRPACWSSSWQRSLRSERSSGTAAAWAQRSGTRCAYSFKWSAAGDAWCGGHMRACPGLWPTWPACMYWRACARACVVAPH